MLVKIFNNHYKDLIFSKTMKSMSLLLSANILNGIIGFFTSIIVLRYVDKEVIAVIYPLISILLIIGQFGDLGLSNSFIKIASSYFQSDRHQSLQYFNAAFKLKLYLCVLLMLIGVPLAPQIAQWTFGEVNYVPWVRLIILITSFQIMSSYATSALQVEGKFKSLSSSKVLPNLFKLLMILVLVKYKEGNLFWMFWAFNLVPILTFLIAFFYSNRAPLFNVKSTNEQFMELFHVSKWITLSALANAVMGQLDSLMIRRMSGIDEFNRLIGGQKLASIFAIITASIITVLLPKVTSMKSKKELNFFLRKGLKFILPLSIALLLVLPFSRFLISSLLGEKYSSSIEVFNILMIAHIVSLIVSPISLILYTLNKEPLFAYLNIYQLIINIVGNYFFIKSNGAVGACWVTVGTNLLAVLIIYYELYKEGILFYRES